jgi:hypothetical protein
MWAHRVAGLTSVVLLLVLGVAGCAATGDPREAPDPGNGSASEAAADDLLCAGLSISPDALRARAPLSSLAEPLRAALSAATWDDAGPVDFPAEDAWYVATTADDVIGVMRDLEVAVDPVSGVIPPDREMRTVAWVDAPNVEPGWYVTSSGPCALTVDLGDLTVPAIELQDQLDPGSREIRLLVTEQSCNSGEDAQGRVVLVSLDEAADTVSLVLGVRPRGGINACPSHPATPFTVTLSEPLGQRVVVDVGLVDPRPLVFGG